MTINTWKQQEGIFDLYLFCRFMVTVMLNLLPCLVSALIHYRSLETVLFVVVFPAQQKKATCLEHSAS